MKRVFRFLQYLIFCGLALHLSLDARIAPRSASLPDKSTGALERVLPIQEFIRLAASNDTVFEQILIDELFLQYSRDLQLPVRDLILAAKGDYDFFLQQDRDDVDVEMSLSKLFPMIGTEISGEYATSPSFSSRQNTSTFTALISQPIAENAFGKATRLRNKIIGLEIDVAMHQIVEAYEDYLAAVITAYLDWYEAYENLQVGQSSYKENLKLLKDIRSRKKHNIALPIDVNKISLQVTDKEETLIELRQAYGNTFNIIERSIRLGSDKVLIPEEPHLYEDIDRDFDRSFRIFKETSRTYKILNLLEDKSSLQVDKDADDLLPSIDLRFGYNFAWQGRAVEKENGLWFVGMAVEWPFPDQVERAEYETSKITQDKTRLSTINTHYRLYANIRNLSQQIDREDKLKKIAVKRIELANAILEDETENYSFGKVTINDYIDAVNGVDNNRFNKIFHDVQHMRLIIEWMRITDRLVSRREIEARRP